MAGSEAAYATLALGHTLAKAICSNVKTSTPSHPGLQFILQHIDSLQKSVSEVGVRKGNRSVIKWALTNFSPGIYDEPPPAILLAPPMSGRLTIYNAISGGNW